ncbi:MAG: carboxypeptidase regulatory-like domain-containing protein, partial [Prevotella sp.]|nr:carboxypeptidase regulatory-like domain-containing protein [Prevotella sp.]
MGTKRLLIIAWLILVLPLAVLAQTKVTGVVVDANGKPLTGVIVQVRNNATNKMVRFGKTDGKGAFSIEADANSYLEASMLGFTKQRINNFTDKKPLRIVMQEEAVALKEVTVKASKVREHGDTLTYNVATFADQNDRSIGDVLARIPGFEVNKQSGQIMYEGKPISKFYIEGLDMLGDKYGVATNSLPQVDVGSVQVMRNHQPIRVLEDFTYTDEAAVNIRMKEGAKSRWVTSLSGGAGISHDTGLWRAEAFGLRLKSDFQTMLTYKTNNTGTNISKETTSLLNFEDMENRGDYISLASPAVPSLKESRTLFNRSHAATVNTMKRLDESSQINLQLIYNNNRETAQGERRTEYLLPGGNRIVESRKDYLLKDNELYALVKYEKNSERQYLKNSLSGNFTWSRQWLNEYGADNYHQYARKPEYDIKHNLYIIRRYGNSLVSFYSNNRATSRPQSLTVDSLFQHISQQRYSTDTYAMGGTKLGRFNLSLKAGVNAALHRLASDATGLPDTLGLLADDARFTAARLYIEPKLTYKTRDISIELTPTTEYLYEKYSEDKANRQLLFSPDISVRWYVTPRLRLSLGGYSSVEPADASRFYRALIMQDFQYINRGWTGYRHNRAQSVRGSISYNDALKSLHSILSASRTFTTSPYTPTRQFVGNYIILSATEQETKSDSWQANLIASK